MECGLAMGQFAYFREGSETGMWEGSWYAADDCHGNHGMAQRQDGVGHQLSVLVVHAGASSAVAHWVVVRSLVDAKGLVVAAASLHVVIRLGVVTYEQTRALRRQKIFHKAVFYHVPHRMWWWWVTRWQWSDNLIPQIKYHYWHQKHQSSTNSIYHENWSNSGQIAKYKAKTCANGQIYKLTTPSNYFVKQNVRSQLLQCL